MKKTLFALFFVLLMFCPKSIYGQIPGLPDVDKMVPGIGCGVAQEKGIDKCCSPQIIQCPRLPAQSVLEHLPFIGGKIKDYSERCKTVEELQKEYGNVSCVFGEPSTPNPADPNCRCQSTASANTIPQLADMCRKYLILTDPNELKKCLNCATNDRLWTAIGCVPLNLASFVNNYLLSLGIGLGGLIALLCIVFSAISMQASQANPEKIKKAQENLTSCILGLILIIFSVFILRLIGVDILKIPGLGK